MKTIVKIALGVILAVVLLIAGCAALIGGAANEVQKDSDRTAITQDQYRQVKTGHRKSDVEAELGDPQSADEFSSEIDGLDKPVGSSCIRRLRSLGTSPAVRLGLARNETASPQGERADPSTRP